jgi:hypothetical protein
MPSPFLIANTKPNPIPRSGRPAESPHSIQESLSSVDIIFNIPGKIQKKTFGATQAGILKERQTRRRSISFKSSPGAKRLKDSNRREPITGRGNR